MYARALKSNEVMHTEFVILVASYNNEKFVEDNLKSICFQESSMPYHIICINDCSTDRTGLCMEEYVRQHHLENKVTIIHNKERIGSVANVYETVHKLPDHKVVVIVDGDDLLKDNKVLLRLEQAYKDPDIWLTYGQALSFPQKNVLKSEKVPDRIFYNREIRKYKWVTSHLRTFKAGLFKKIKKEHLLYQGKFIMKACDLAIMFPMLEMAGPKNELSKIRSTFIEDILYLYRRNNPLSVHKVSRSEQVLMDKYIRSLAPYEPLDSL